MELLLVFHFPQLEVNPETTTVTVTVTSKDDKVASAKVTLTGDENSYTGTTGSAGGCSLKDVEVGTYTVTATATGYKNYTGTVNVSSENNSISIDMTASS